MNENLLGELHRGFRCRSNPKEDRECVSFALSIVAPWLQSDEELSEAEVRSAVGLVFERRDIAVAMATAESARFFVGLELAAVMEFYNSGRTAIILDSDAMESEYRCKEIHEAGLVLGPHAYELAKACSHKMKLLPESNFFKEWQQERLHSTKSENTSASPPTAAARLSLKLGLGTNNKSKSHDDDEDAGLIRTLASVPTALLYLTPLKFHSLRWRLALLEAFAEDRISFLIFNQAHNVKTDPVYASSAQCLATILEAADCRRKRLGLDPLPRIPRACLAASTSNSELTSELAALLNVYRLRETARPSKGSRIMQPLRASDNSASAKNCRTTATSTSSARKKGTLSRTTRRAPPTHQHLHYHHHHGSRGDCTTSAFEITPSSSESKVAATGMNRCTGDCLSMPPSSTEETRATNNNHDDETTTGDEAAQGQANNYDGQREALRSSKKTGVLAPTKTSTLILPRRRSSSNSVASALFKQEEVDDDDDDDDDENNSCTTPALSPTPLQKRNPANYEDADIDRSISSSDSNDENIESIETKRRRQRIVTARSTRLLNADHPREEHRVSMALSRSRNNDGGDSSEGDSVDVSAALQKEALLALLHQRALEEERLQGIIEQRDQEIEQLKRQAVGMSSANQSDAYLVSSSQQKHTSTTISKGENENDDRTVDHPQEQDVHAYISSSTKEDDIHDTTKKDMETVEEKDEDPRLRKYRRMLAMHVPRGAVEVKMRSEGLNPALLDGENCAVAEKKDEVDNSNVPVSKDSRFIKFFKMLSFHIPRGAVDVKMQAEGLNPAVLDLDPTKPLPPSFPIKAGAANGVAPPKLNSALLKKKSAVTTKEEEHYIKLRGLYWHRIKMSEIGGTIWEKINATKYDLLDHDTQREAIRNLVDHASGLSAKARTNMNGSSTSVAAGRPEPAPPKLTTIADVEAKSKQAERSRRRHSSWHITSGIANKSSSRKLSSFAMPSITDDEDESGASQEEALSSNPILNAIQARRRCSTTATIASSRDDEKTKTSRPEVEQAASSSYPQSLAASRKRPGESVVDQERKLTLSAKLRNYAKVLGSLRCKMSAISFFERRIHEVAPHKVVVLAKDLVVDMQALEDLFRDVTASGGTLGHAITPNKKKVSEEVRILDPKRAQSVQITLGSIKVGSFGQIRDAIIALDAKTLPHLTNAAGTEVLLSILPTQEEYGKVRAYVDDGKDVSKLAPAERFFAIVGEIPRLTPRLSCVLELLRFDETLDHVLEQADSVECAALRLEKVLGVDLESAISSGTASHQHSSNSSEARKRIIRQVDISSAPLAAFLCVVLAAGNRMNQGSKGRGEAAGFQLEILTKLVNVKCNDAKAGTFLTFVVDQIGLERTSKLIAELNTPVQRASRVNYDLVEKDFDQLEKIIETRVFRELKHGSGTLEDDSYRRPFLAFCGEFSDHATRRLESARIVVARARSVVERVARFLKADLYDTSGLAENCDGVQQFFATLKLFLAEVEAAIVFNAKRRKAQEEERKRERQRALVKAKERAAAEERKRKKEAEEAAAAAVQVELQKAAAEQEQNDNGTNDDNLAAGNDSAEPFPVYECSQCVVANSSMIAGAFSLADGGWYCSDCWYLFSEVKETWQEEFGEETAPLGEYYASPEDSTPADDGIDKLEPLSVS